MTPPLSLYVHMPWCVSKCPYCDFNSHALRGELAGDAYIDALLRDLATEATRGGSRLVETVFIGGGTPSLFSGEQIGRLLDAVAASLPLAPDCEITMEANPGTVEHGRLDEYRRAGVNRLSIGAQSFDENALIKLGRVHNPDDTRRVFGQARAAGFDNINLDIMFGLPGQDLAGAMADVATAAELGPEHISHYQLTLEPNTAFYHSPPLLPGDEETWDMQVETGQVLAASGFRRYEVSAFSQAGRACRHNLNYWRFGDYLAVGAGAHGKFTDADNRLFRYSKPANPRSYLQAMATPDFAVAERPVTEPERVFEFFLNVLRLADGFDLHGLGEVSDEARTLMTRGLEEAEERGLVAPLPGERWQPTEFGFRFLNDLQAVFLP